MSPPRLLVIEGNTAEGRFQQTAAGGSVAIEGYAKLLRGLLPGAEIDVVFAADPGAEDRRVAGDEAEAEQAA